MARTRFPLAALLALMVALLPACASGGAGVNAEAGAEVGASSGPTVVVNNNLSVPTALTVSIVPETGVRRLLGNVSPSGNSTLRYGGTPIGRYRLVARTTSGAEIVSDPFVFGGGNQVTWDLQSNIIRITGG